MRKLLLGALTLLSLQSQAQIVTSVQDPADWVNPLMGTASKHSLSQGNTYPAIALPWGMNFWMPQTGKMGDGWAYTYDAEKIRGFKQTHQPSPWINDYGQFVIMPVTGKPKFRENDRASWFSHKSETARPYYYSVYLADHDVTTEITPTERAARFRFTYPKTDSAFVIIDALDRGSFVKVIPAERKIIGYTTRNSGGVPANFKNYFVIYFDKPFSYQATWKDSTLSAGILESKSNHSGAIIGFATVKGEKVQAKVASSFISPEQAELNLLQEIGNRSFDDIKTQAKATWNKELGRILVTGGTVDQTRTFYSCLYRVLLFPRKFYEMNEKKEVVHYSPYNGQVLPGYMFTDNGFWDTFRSAFPFFNLMYPEMNSHIMQGLVNAYKESGWLPEWASPGHRDCMIGSNSASIIADAYIKGVRNFDVNTAFEALQKNAENEGPLESVGRRGVKYYNELGYVPYDVKINENAARTLEYAYDDFTIYQLAKAIKRPADDISKYEKRSQNFRNLFDKETRLMRGRNKDGNFQSPFNPFKWGDAFTEGNSWHYTWSVFHDVKGLANLMGGREMFVKMLDSVFVMPPVYDDSYYNFTIHEIREMQIMNMGQYAHGNQPIQHMIYLYNYAGAPWKAQYWLREVMDRLYTPTPDGYCGDEDNGQTSAWYVFSALGFYPVCPGTTQYVVGSPLFKNATIKLENGKTLQINAADNGPDKRYIQKMEWNGKALSQNWLDHFELMKGGQLNFRMSAQPEKNRGTAVKDAPFSYSDAK
ncbi:GH92 family glycosyl hydrolase [Chitinophaga pendula]|uniref:GH92 family glycosyl hydrolase n=1 Tax=Chitinophaga TaxID=79328 RepID=UPI000BAEBFAB|nr:MULTISPECIES: GH92 family glycosyl hydrolase [Chitinophaga]ASZ11026.1 alpha-mannosidase [Chitinophaga sp. MD30]UCJ05978.1 GH92 family glycosyl hydrolase [Chitinophaga pendula]